MTGYGKTIAEVPGKKFTIEIRTLNSKGLDLNVKIPSWLREKELDIRDMLSTIQRGKTDLFIQAEYTGESLPYSINRPLAIRYFEELTSLRQEVNDETSESLIPHVLRMPDVLQTNEEGIEHDIWEKIHHGIALALEKVDEYRRKEGKVLEEEFASRVAIILDTLDKIHPFEERLDSRNIK